ncbi:MAG: DUF2281 domain-containing protein [Chloroflexi bacterium]|nr:DUF2281 domain-containing protein [Chloroflexota bacterium]
MMIETAVLTRLRRLPYSQKQEVLNFVEFLEAKLASVETQQTHHLDAAARALLSDYESDLELTAFTALDSEFDEHRR